MSESIKHKTVKGVWWSAIDRFSSQGVSFILGLLMARILSPEDYGIIGMLGIFMAISQTFIDSGFSNALIRKIDRTETDCSTAFYFNVVVGIICYGILFFSAPYIAKFFNTTILTDVVRVISINIFLSSLTIVQVAKLTINIDFKSQAKVSLTSTLLSGILGLYLAYAGYGVWALVGQSVSRSTLTCILLWIVSKWRPKESFSWDSFKSLFSYGSKLLASGLLHTIYKNMTTLAIGKFYSAQDLGYYSRGEQFASLPSTNLTNVIQRVTFPILSNLQNNNERLIQVYRKYVCITSMGIFFGMALLAALAKPIILLILTEKWAKSIIFLQIFCFALMFDHICLLNLNLLQVKGRSDLFLKLEIIKKTISFTILLIAIPFGVLAICISSVIYTQIAVYINTYYSGKLFNMGYMSQIKDFGKYFIIAIISVSPTYILTYTQLSNLTIIIIGLILSLSLYILLLSRDCYMNEVFLLIKGLLKNK